MNCYFHVDQPAVAQCNICGKGLCKECASKYEEVVCDDCVAEIDAEIEAERILEQERKRKLFKAGAIIHIISVVGAVFLSVALIVGFIYFDEAYYIKDYIGPMLLGLVLNVLTGGTTPGYAYSIGKYLKKWGKFQGIFTIPVFGWILYCYWLIIIIFGIGLLVGWLEYMGDLIKWFTKKIKKVD